MSPTAKISILIAASIILLALVACSGETPPPSCQGPWTSFPQPMPDIEGAPPVVAPARQTMVQH